MIELALGRTRVAFTTRQGGHSKAPYTSANLSENVGDSSRAVDRNLTDLGNRLGLAQIVRLNQVHGSRIADPAELTAAATPLADGATLVEPGIAVLITGADCPGVTLASENRTVALHCGWRSVATGLVEQACEVFGEESFDAVVGPGICQRHFEVGPEVVGAMGEDGPRFSDGRQLDIVGIISERLRRGGAVTVDQVDLCTYCSQDDFFSHRRDGEPTGRQGMVVWRT